MSGDFSRNKAIKLSMVTESLDHPKQLDKNLTTKFVRSLEKGLRARDYQIDAIHNILESDRGLILSPTGSGKSFIIYALVRYYIEKLDQIKKYLLLFLPQVLLSRCMATSQTMDGSPTTTATNSMLDQIRIHLKMWSYLHGSLSTN